MFLFGQSVNDLLKDMLNLIKNILTLYKKKFLNFISINKLKIDLNLIYSKSLKINVL